MVDANRIQEHAQRLLDAQERVQAVAGPTQLGDSLSVDEAFAVQAMVADRRAGDGSRRIRGYKAGLGAEPFTGRALARDVVFHGGDIPFAEMITPKVEPELAFVVGERLEGDDLVVTDVLRATDFVVPGLEIIDSRLEGGMGSPRSDLIADNGSFGRAVLGTCPVGVAELDLADVAVELAQDGKVMDRGRTDRASSHPAHAVVIVAALLHHLGMALEPGDFVLTGSCTTPLEAVAGTVVSARFQGIGAVEVQFT